jgi:hypothetical protein
VIGFSALIVLLATPLSPINFPIHPGYALEGSTALHSRTEVGLEALSYQIERDDYRAGETVFVTLYWQTLRFLPFNYRTQLSLLNSASGEQISTNPMRHPGGYPTQRWLTNRYITDPYSIPIPANINPGDYAIGVEVFNCSSNCTSQNRLTFFDDAGTTLGQTLILPVVLTVEPL